MAGIRQAPRPSTSTQRIPTAVAVLQLALFVALGLPDGALGVAWPTMRASVDRNLGDLAWVLAAGTVGYLLASTNVARASARWGSAGAITAATALATAALAGWAVAGWWPVLLLASLGLGVARGATDAGLNAYLALHGGVRRLGLLHAMFGVGTTIGPLVVVAALELPGGWRTAWGVLVIVHAALTVWAWAVRTRWPADVAAPPPSPDVGDRRRSGLPVIMTLAVFAAYVGAEFATGAWAYTLLTEVRGVDATAAGIAVSAFWGGLTAGRLALALGGHKVSRRRLVRVSCLSAWAGVAFLAWDPGGLGLLGLPVAGLGFAPVFPALVALTPDRLGAHRASAVIGWSVAAASLGGTSVSVLAGVLVDRIGPEVLAPVFVVATGLLVLLEWTLARVTRRPVA